MPARTSVADLEKSLGCIIANTAPIVKLHGCKKRENRQKISWNADLQGFCGAKKFSPGIFLFADKVVELGTN